MKGKRYSRRQLACSALAGFLAALALTAVALWSLMGAQGLAVLGGWSLARVLFVGDYEPDALADAALNGLVSGLGDRWSYYVNAEGYQSLKESRSNTYVGIGVTVSHTDERGLLVESVREGGPADGAGVLPGEIILAIDGREASGESRYHAAEWIRGERGSAVRLTLLDRAGERREVTVSRETIHIEPVVHEMLEGKVGYIAIANFNSGVAQAFQEAVDDLISYGAEALVFDVRNNGGGYVDQLTLMLDRLLPEGPIFRSQGNWGWERVTRSDEACVNLPMAVLVNGDTYSAAEFFAAQLQESAGAILVGEPTFGKGFSQQTFPLPNGGALNFSTEKYHTGGGVSLIGTGVSLDAKVDLDREFADALRAGTLPHEEDTQLQKALELLKQA